MLAYLKSAELELQVFLLIEQLREAVGQDDVGVVEAAVLLVKLVVLVVSDTTHVFCGFRNWSLLLRRLLHSICAIKSNY